MPAPNDLTPEEEQAFVEHGVQPAGPGSEPIVENDGDVQQQGQQHGDRQAGEAEPAAPSRHRPDGTFKTREELDAELAAAATAAATEQANVDGQPPAEGGQPKTVPLEALHSERQRANKAIQQAQLATARMNALLAAQQGQQQQQQPPLPNLNEDPVGYIQQMEERLQRFETERAQETQSRQIDEGLRQDEQLFSQSVPDYDAASDHYVQSRAQELLQFHAPDEAQRIMMAEARSIAQQAWQRGMSAGQMVYQLAQARGYVPSNTAASPQNAPIPARPTGPSAQAVVTGIKAGQAASRSLSGGAGAASAQTLNAEALLAMSDEEFEQHLGIGTKGVNSRFAAVG